jgi:hypothetical protein
VHFTRRAVEEATDGGEDQNDDYRASDQQIFTR